MTFNSDLAAVAFTFTASSTVSLYSSLKAGHLNHGHKTKPYQSFRTLLVVSGITSLALILPLAFFSSAPFSAVSPCHTGFNLCSSTAHLIRAGQCQKIPATTSSDITRFHPHLDTTTNPRQDPDYPFTPPVSSCNKCIYLTSCISCCYFPFGHGGTPVLLRTQQCDVGLHPSRDVPSSR